MIISWNTTRQCNLLCKHCYRASDAERDPDELNTEEGFGLLDEIAKAGFKIMVLSGGEPLMREDIYDLIAHGKGLGLRTVLGSNGTLIDHEVAQRLKDAGTARVGISLDSVQPDKHDEFRSCEGAWEKSIAGMKHCRDVGLPFQLHTTVTERNYDEVLEMTDLAVDLGAAGHHIFFLVPTGRGKDLAEESLQAAQYERLLNRILEKQQSVEIELKPTCAPQFMRIAKRKGMNMRFTKGCLAGTSYCVIIPNGDVHPCPYLPIKVGNVRETPFSDIWANAEMFKTLRENDLKGKCGACDYRTICAGCRARAFANTTDFLSEDPDCSYGAA